MSGAENVRSSISCKDGNGDPPELDINLPKLRGLPATKKEPSLPIDILLLTVKDCEFLGCHAHLRNSFKWYFDGLGYVYFGNATDDQDENVKVALMRCDEGSTSTGGSLTTVKNAVTVLRPKAVISVGYCSGLNHEITKLGDVVVSAKLTTYASKEVIGGQEQSIGTRNLVSRRFLHLIRNVADGWIAPLKIPEVRDVKIHNNGEFLSGPEKISADWRRKELVQLHPQATAIEMEGEGVFAAAFDHDIEWLLVKGIADFADDNESSTVTWRSFASVMAASVVFNFLSDPNVLREWPHYQENSRDIKRKLDTLMIPTVEKKPRMEVPASITNVSGDQTVCEGSTMQLVCEATGEPTPDITWTRVLEDGSSSEVLHEGPTWDFQNIRRTASGTYLCKASNGVGNPVSQEVKVTVDFVGAYTRALKASITSQTEFQPKLLASPTISNKKTDEIFTNILIQHGRKALSKDGRRLTRSEHLSHYGQVSGTQVKNCEEIFIRTTNEEQNPKSILLTGKAGIGKSLFCQKLIRDWAGNKLFHSQDVLIPDFKFAYLLTFRQLNLLGDDCGTLRELLNCSSVLDDNSNIDDSLFDYIINHPEEVLIIFDGYDEYLRQDDIADISEEQYPNNAKGKMPVAALCAKLIKGKILRDSVVMVTSRPDESDKLGGINFNRYVEITGFSPQQVKENIERYFRGKERMKNAVLKHVMNNGNLVSFAHIPMLCFLMCWYFEYTLTKSESTIDLPVSATDLYSEVVDIFELKHNDESEYKTKEIPAKHKASTVVKSTFDKLSELAAHLLLQKKPIFDEGDMEEKFSLEELEKLKASGLLHCGPPFWKSAFETTKHFSFTHLTVHEFLAARWFVEKEKIPEDVSAMVMQFMAGIISKKKGDNSQLMEKLLESIPSLNEKQALLLRAKCLSEHQDMEFAKTYVKNHSHQFSVPYEGMSFEELTDVDCIAISFLLDVISALNEEEATMPAQHERSEQSFTVEKIEISSSYLTLSGIERICKSLEKEHCGITELSVFASPLTDKCVHSISRIVSSKLKELSLMSASMTDTDVASLCGALQNSNCKLTTLDLSGNHITYTGALSLCEVLQNSNCKLTTLYLIDNAITDTGALSLCEVLQNSNCKVTKLDLSNNHITDTGALSLFEVLQNSNCKVTTLDLSYNHITDTGVASLFEVLQNSNCKLTSLYLYNNYISEETEESLRILVQQHRPDLKLRI